MGTKLFTLKHLLLLAVVSIFGGGSALAGDFTETITATQLDVSGTAYKVYTLSTQSNAFFYGGNINESSDGYIGINKKGRVSGFIAYTKTSGVTIKSVKIKYKSSSSKKNLVVRGDTINSLESTDYSTETNYTTGTTITGTTEYVYDLTKDASGNPTSYTSVSFYPSGTGVNTVEYIEFTWAGCASSPNLEFSESDVSVRLDQSFVAPKLSVAGGYTGKGEITFSTPDNNGVAAVDATTGLVSILGTGSTTITATAAAVVASTNDESWSADTASYTLTVTTAGSEAVGGTYEKVTSADSIDTNGNYIFVATKDSKSYVATPTADYDSNTRFGATEVTPNTDGTITLPSDDYNFIIGEATDAYTLQSTLTGKYYSGSSTKINSSTSSSASWSFTATTLTEGGVRVCSSGGSRWIGVNDTYMRLYQDASAYPDALLYKRTATNLATVGTITINTDEGWGTYYTDKAYTMPKGLTGYIVTGAENGKLTLEKKYEANAIVPGGTPLLVKGTNGESYGLVEATTEETAPTGNKLYGAITSKLTSEICSGTGSGTPSYYKLTYSKSGDTKTLGFYYGAAAGAAFTNNPYRAFLVLDGAGQEGQARGFSFADANISTGIQSAVVTTTASDPEAVYNLQGIRVASRSTMNRLPKGVYIVRGKKVLVK